MSEERESDRDGTEIWRPTELGDVIAERELTFESDAGARTLLLQFGRPVQGPKEEDPWWCPMKVEGLGPPEVRGIAGVDAMQALLLALKLARDVLPTIAEREGGKLYWLSDDLDAVFDQRDNIRLLENGLEESLSALEAAEPHLHAAGTSAEEAATVASRVILKYRDTGSGPPDERPPSHERGVFERARTLYFRLRHKYEPGEGQ